MDKSFLAMDHFMDVVCAINKGYHKIKVVQRYSTVVKSRNCIVDFVIIITYVSVSLHYEKVNWFCHYYCSYIVNLR